MALRFFLYAAALVSFTLNGLLCCAQSTVIDSLEKMLPKAATDSARMEILRQLAKNYDNVDTGKARGYYREMAAVAQRTGSEIFEGYANEMAGVLWTRYDQKKALQHYNTALSLLNAHQDNIQVKRTIASLNNNLGIIHYFNGDLDGALRYFIGATRFYEENDKKNLNLGFGYGNISTAYADLQKPDLALAYSKKAFDFAEKSNNKNLLMTGCISYGSNLLKAKRPDEGMPYLEKGKSIAVELKNNYNLYLYYFNIADYNFNKEEYKTALAAYTSALQFARVMDSPHEIGFMYTNMANCHTHLSNLDSARHYLDEALRIVKETGMKDLEQAVYDVRADLSSKTGDYKKALEFRNRFIELKDSAYAADNIKRTEFLEAQYQAEKKEQEIRALQKDTQIQALRIKQKSTLNAVLIGSLAALLLVLFLLYRNFKHRQQLALQQDVLQRQRISELEKDRQLIAVDSMLKGQEEERSRLAKDLHDGLGGLLSGVKYSLSNMKDNLIITPENMTVFERSLDMLDTSIRELRRVAHNMMPELLTKFGLNEALKEYCNSINATRRLSVQFQSFGIDERLETTTEIFVYRIVQELVNNILKHAGASTAFVQVIRQGNRLNLIVEDNGKGFDTASLEHNKGAGWENIRSRVDYLKGKVDIHADAGKGTLVNIEFNVAP